MLISLLAGTPVITGLIASGVETSGALLSEDKVPLLFGKVTVVLATYEPACTFGTVTVAFPFETVPVWLVLFGP